jgi:nucleoside-diphosphate-sugar epimerase
MVHYASQVIERVLIFRPHNIYGPSMGNEHVIPQLLNKIALHKDNSQIKLQIQGNGLESRAFTYVTDLLQGLEILLSRGKNGEIYNIGNPKEVSILELIELIEKIIDKTINVLPGMIQSGSPLRRLPDISKIELLGFKPKVDIEEGLKLTIPHYLKS